MLCSSRSEGPTGSINPPFPDPGGLCSAQRGTEAPNSSNSDAVRRSELPWRAGMVCKASGAEATQWPPWACRPTPQFSMNYLLFQLKHHFPPRSPRVWSTLLRTAPQPPASVATKKIQINCALFSSSALPCGGQMLEAGNRAVPTASPAPGTCCRHSVLGRPGGSADEASSGSPGRPSVEWHLLVLMFMC